MFHPEEAKCTAKLWKRKRERKDNSGRLEVTKTSLEVRISSEVGSKSGAPAASRLPETV